MYETSSRGSMLSSVDTRLRGLSRLVDVVIDPVAAFRGIDARPTWGIALLALIALRFTSVLAFYRPDTTPGKLVAGVLFQIVTLLPFLTAMALLLRIVATVCDARVSWASAWSVTTHVMFAYTLLTIAIASIAGALLPESAEIDLRNPPFTSLGFLVDKLGAPTAHAMLDEVDVRSAYALALVWLGVRAASGGNSIGAAYVVATCFGLNVLVAVGSALVR